MLKDYNILNGEEVARFDMTSKDFKDKVIQVTNMNGRALYLVPSDMVPETPEQKYDKLIEELLEEFEFNKVAQIMYQLDWTWYGEEYPPTIEEMKKCVRSLYESIRTRILENIHCFCATGGFNLTFNPDEDQELKLTFEAVQYSVFGTD